MRWSRGVQIAAACGQLRAEHEGVAPAPDSPAAARAGHRARPRRPVTTVAYFDCPSGISGDMALGALLDAGLSLDALAPGCARPSRSSTAIGWDGARQPARHRRYAPHGRARPRPFAAPARLAHHSRHADGERPAGRRPASAPWRSSARWRGGSEDSRHSRSRRSISTRSARSIRSWTSPGWRSACTCSAWSGSTARPCSDGRGTTRSQHGIIPIPAPATLALLAAAGAPLLEAPTDRELVTPTGAAIVAALAEFRQPALRLRAVGYGFGKRELPWPNALRVWLGERRAGCGTGSAERDEGEWERGAVAWCCWRRTSTT